MKQADLVWDIYGPYENKGNLSKVFAPESIKFNALKEKPKYKATGGTLVMKHWWAPLISGCRATARKYDMACSNPDLE